MKNKFQTYQELNKQPSKPVQHDDDCDIDSEELSRTDEEEHDQGSFNLYEEEKQSQHSAHSVSLSSDSEVYDFGNFDYKLSNQNVVG